MKRLAVILTIVVSLSVCFYLLCKPDSLPTADLASPSQEVRDAAAKILREKAKTPWKTKWLFFSWKLKAGENETNILNLLRSYNLSTQIESGMGGIGEYWEYRLDDYWLLGVALNNNDYKNRFLDHWRLVPRWRAVAVWPATNFTGSWINYYANGQKFTEDFFQNGLRHGEFVTYFPEGTKSSVAHCVEGKANGMRTQYFPGGQIQDQTFYSNDRIVGESVRFFTNGIPMLRQYFDNGERNGPMTVYFPSGKIRFSYFYTNGEQVGLEISYNEDGTTNSVIDRSK